MKKLLLLALILLIPPFVSAGIQDFNVEIRISNSRALISYDIQTDMSSIQLILPEDARINEAGANYSLENGIFISDVMSGNLKLSYFTDKFVESNKYFTADFKIPETENLDVRLILPEFAVIDSAYPPAELTSDGKHIILDWKSQNTTDFPVFVIYNEKGTAWQWIIAALAVIFLISAILILKRRATVKAKQGLKAKRPSKEIHLLEPENSVIKALKEGAVWQKQIQIKTGFSKAKLSRTIRNLEARKLVKRIPLGNTNKIKLLK